MAQRLPRSIYLAAGVALLVLAGCKPSPLPFDGHQAQTHQAVPTYAPQSAALPAPTGATTAANWDAPAARTVKVGLLLPLSGQSYTVGKALQDAAVMALFDKYATLSGPQAGVRVELVPMDTKETPAGARQAAADAIKQGAELIIGPLFSQSVEAIKPLAATGKISIITFSNNREVAGDGVFTLGFNPAEQTQRVTQYAFMKGVNRMAVLAPNDAYGKSVIDTTQQVAKLLGRKVEPVIRYSPAGGTLNDDIRTLAKEGAQGVGLAFDALMLPEGGEKLGPMLHGLAAANIKPQSVQFVGTGQWDDRDLVRNHDLSGALLASSPPEMYEAFEQRFMSTYGYKPPRIASLAYDAVALAATLATTQGGFSRDAIADPSGFMGPANGLFRFKPDGLVERGLAVLQIQNGAFKTVDPAKQSFQ